MSGELLYQQLRGCNYKKVRNGSEMTPFSPEMMPETKQGASSKQAGYVQDGRGFPVILDTVDTYIYVRVG